MEIGNGERYVCLTGKAPKETKFKFLMLTPAEVTRFTDATDRGRELLVWMLLLNAQRHLRVSEFRFTPRLRRGVELPEWTLRRSLQRLADVGLIELDLCRGKSPVVRMHGGNQAETASRP